MKVLANNVLQKIFGPRRQKKQGAGENCKRNFKFYSADQIKENEVSGAYNTYEGK